MAYCEPPGILTAKAASTFTPLGFSFSHIQTRSKIAGHVKHCLEVQRRNKNGTDPYNDSTTPSYSIVLWHEGYYQGKPWYIATEGSAALTELQSYFDSIVGFAKSLQESKGIPTRMLLTVPAPITGVVADSPFLTALVKAMSNALLVGLSIGFQIASEDFTNLTAVVQALGHHDYIVAVDNENFGGIKAKNVSEWVQTFEASLNKEGIFPTQIPVAGTAAFNSNWEAPLVNVWEMYGETPYDTAIASNRNKPQAAFAALSQIPSTSDVPNGFKSTISGNGVPGWYAFDMACAGSLCDCLAPSFGKKSKANPCGSYTVFGKWSLKYVLEFLGLVQANLYPGSSPTFVLYQSDFLPMAWISE